MKKLLAALAALLLAPACLAVGPYLAGSSMPAGELPALMGRVEQKLRDDGFAVVGRHLPPGLPQHGSVIVTDPALNQAARKAGGTAVLATALRIGVKSDGSISYMNPDYWGRAYLREGFAGAEPAPEPMPIEWEADERGSAPPTFEPAGDEEFTVAATDMYDANTVAPPVLEVSDVDGSSR